jgi:hypothetical protein
MATEETERCTLESERQRDGLGDPATGTGDDRNPVRERALHYANSFNNKC